MTKIKKDQITYFHFTVFDTDGITPLTGQAGSCTYYLTNDNAEASESVTIAEIGTSGHYYATFTPTNVGEYDLEVTCPDDRVIGESYIVENHDLDDIGDNTDNLPADPTSETNATSNKDDIIAEVDLPIVKPEIVGIPLFFDINNFVGLPTGASIELRLYNLNGDQITSGQITNGGNHNVIRFRDGGFSLIDSGANVVNNGYVSFALDFTREDWKHGDLLYLGFTAVEITVDSRVIDVEAMYQSSFVYDRFSDVAKRGLVTTGSTTTEIHTDLTESDDFYNNMQVVLFSSTDGVVVRNIDDYAQTNGAITVEELPFTPAENDEILILSRTGSVPIDTGAVADSVWDEAISGHNNAGSFGSKNQNLVPSEAIADYRADLTPIEDKLDDSAVIENNVIAPLQFNVDADPDLANVELSMRFWDKSGNHSLDDTHITQAGFYTIMRDRDGVRTELVPLTPLSIEIGACKVYTTVDLSGGILQPDDVLIFEFILTELTIAGKVYSGFFEFNTIPIIGDYIEDIDSIKSKTDNLPADPASETNVDANEAKIDIIDSNVDDILTDTDEIQGKLPTNYIMGSSDQTDKDDEIDDIKSKTDNLPADPASESTIIADLLTMKQKTAGSYDRDTDSLEALRENQDEGDLASIDEKIDAIQEDIGDPSSDPVYPSLQAKLNVLVDELDIGTGSIKVYGVVTSNWDDTPQQNIRVTVYDRVTLLPLVEAWTNADGEWHVFIDPGIYVFEFAGQPDNVDGFRKTNKEVTVDASPSEQNYGTISIEPTQIDEGSGSETVGWNGSVWTFGTSPTEVLGEVESNVRVRAWLESDPKTTDYIKAQDYSDIDGRWTLYLDPGTYVIKYFKPRYQPSSETIVVT